MSWRNSLTVVLLTWAMVIGAGLLLTFGPPSLAGALEALVTDASSSGLGVLTSFYPVSHVGSESPTHGAREMESLKRANTALQYRIAQLQEQLTQQDSYQTYPLSGRPPLLQSHLIASQVLGEAGQLSPVSQKLIRLGSSHGLVGEELVLDGAGWLLDQGEDAGLQEDQLVSEGFFLVGKVSRVGRFTSSCRSVTDHEFRIAARLVRPSPAGPVFGARGLLTGTGGSCQLDHVPASEAVSVGDAVYCDDSVTEAPLIIGRVSRADLQPTDQFWRIQVTPAVGPTPHQVLVIRTQFNPQRLAERSP